MANDNLSQNIELNVTLNQQSVDKAEEQLAKVGSKPVKVNVELPDFMKELRKELGFGKKTKIRVGGYSTQESPDKETVKKARRSYEKLGGDFFGSGFEETSVQNAAKVANESARDLAKRLGIKYVDEFTNAIGEADFVVPESINFDSSGPEEYKKLLQKATDDFITDAMGGVTISPAMLLAAAERVYEKNPGISVPGGPDPRLAGSMKPGKGIPNVYSDADKAKRFNEFVNQTLDANPQLTASVQKHLEKKLQITFDNIFKEAQKAREATFKGKGDEGDDSVENLIRYADDAARKKIAQMEEKFNLQQGTFATYGKGIVSPALMESRPNAKSDPDRIFKVAFGEYQDDVTGAIVAAVPDPSKITPPLEQALENIFVFGYKFATRWEKKYGKTMERFGVQVPSVPRIKKAAAAKEEAAPKQAPADIRRIKESDVEAYFSKMKSTFEETGKEFVIGFDTEFNKNLPGIITEASLRVKDEADNFVKVFDMFHAPTPDQARTMRAGAFAGNPKNIDELKARAAEAGYKDPVGSTETLQNFMELQAKVRNLATILNVAAKLEIPVIGNNIQGAEWSQSLVPLIKMINTVASGVVPEGMKLSADVQKLMEVFKASGASIDTIHVPQPKLRDLSQIVNAAGKSKVLEADQLRSGNVAGGELGSANAKLGNLLKNSIDIFGANLSDKLKSSIKFLEDGSFSIDGKPSHVASADAEASLVVHDVIVSLSKLSGAVENATKTVSTKEINAANAQASGAGSKPPVEPPAPSGGFAARAEAAEPSAARLALRYKELDQLTRSLTESEAKLVTVTHDRQKGASDHLDVMRNAVTASGGLISADELLFGAESKLENITLERIHQLASYGSSIVGNKEALAALSRIEMQAASGQVKRSDVISDLRTVQKAYNNSMYESIELAKKSEIASRNEVKEEQRKGHVKEVNTQNLRKQIDAQLDLNKAGVASDEIKRQMLDQVAAEKEIQAASKASINQWVTGRYALYDVANAYQNVSRQLFMATRRIFDLTRAYRDYETAFTAVERAMQLDFSDPAQGAKELKDQFIKLSEVIPVAFEELARIATLGAQMGIGAKGIVDFTDTVAQFAAVTGISADTVAQKFGKIAELTDIDATQFKNLGSAVAFAGINAVATESEILTLSESIAAVSNQAGLSAPEVVGLGTALSSVGVPAEQARGVFTRVFADIDRAVSNGSDAITKLGDTSNMTKKQINAAFKDKNALTGFAEAANMSVEEFSAAWGAQGKSYDVFRAILGGISSAEDLTKAFDRLGIVETREINTLTRLANNLNVVDQAVGDSTASFGEGEFLLQSFSKTTDNLDAKLVIFQNNLKSLGEQFGQAFGGQLKGLLDVGSEVLKFLKEMSKSAALQGLTSLTVGAIAFTATGLAMASVLNKVVAQIYAFRVAMINSANDSTAIAGFGKQLKQLTNVGGGLIELRDEMLTPNANIRGKVTPVDYKITDFIRGEKAKQAGLLKTQNIFLASNREQADAIQRLVLLRKLEIDSIMEKSTASGVESEIMRKQLAQESMYIAVKDKEATIITKSQYAELQAAAASERAAGIKNGEATARLKNVTAINAETKAAAGVNSSVAGLGSKVMGFVGAGLGALSVLTAVWGIIDGIRIAVEEANKIDLAGSGLTVEALKGTITEDTQAWLENGQAIATQTSQYEATETATNKYAASVADLDGKLKETYGSQKALVEVTKTQTVALGESTKALVINSILANQKMQELINKNSNMFNDLAAAGVNASSFIDSIMGKPEDAEKALLDIRRKIADTKKKIAIESFNESEYLAYSSDSLPGLKMQLKELEALGIAGKEAFDQIQKAIALDAFAQMAQGYSGGFLDIEKSLKAAMKTGKGMPAVLKNIAKATIEMSTAFVAADRLSGFSLDINSAKTVKEIYAIVEAEHLFIIATKKARAVAAGDAGLYRNVNFTSGLEGSLKNLGLLKTAANSTSDALASTGKAAETLAEKLSRLISESMSGSEKLMAVRSAIRGLGASMKESGDWTSLTEGGASNLSALNNVIKEIGNRAGSNFPKAISDLQILRIVLSDAGLTSKNAGGAFAQIDATIKKLGGTAGLSAAQIAKLRKEFPAIFKELTTGLTAAAAPQKMFKTIADYVNGLKNVLSSAFDVRYGAEAARDDITSSWQSIKDSVDEAKKSIKAANDEINEVYADKKILEYQLSVAERYGDEKRAASIRAKLAKMETDLSDKKVELAKLEAKTTGILTGPSEQAVINRGLLRDIIQKNNTYIAALANMGATTDQLKTASEKLTATFYAQGKALGFSEEELQKYVFTAYADLGIALEALEPFKKQIDFTVNPNPVIRAVSEMVLGVNAELAKVISNMKVDVILPDGSSVNIGVKQINDEIGKITDGVDVDVKLPDGTTIGAAITAINAEIAKINTETKYIDIVTRYLTEGTPAPTGGSTSGSTTTVKPTPTPKVPSTVKPTPTPKVPSTVVDARAEVARLNSVIAKLAARLKLVQETLIPELSKKMATTAPYAQGSAAGAAIMNSYKTQLAALNAEVRTGGSALSSYGAQLAAAKKIITSAGYTFASGGFVSGKGGPRSDSIPAMLSNGEFVMQTSAVKSYGVDFLNAMNQQRVSFAPVQPSVGTQQSTGPQVVYLSPEDRALLREAVDRPVSLYTENTKIAQSANAGNVVLAQRGRV